jgi:hypothetical protein
MGRPLNKRYFGSGAGNQIKVRAKIGANAEGDGRIVSQRGTRKFKVTVGANTGDCFLVDKADGSLAANEMSISVQTDDGVVRRVTKIAAHRVVAGGVSYAWTFDGSITDGKAEMDEVETSVSPFITITSQPTDQTAADGEAVFAVVANVTEGATLTYLWQVSTDSGATWSNTASTNDNLLLLGLQPSDDGNLYRVIVSATGATSVTSNAVTLTVAA